MKLPNYVKRGQIFMCRFEDCWNKANSCIDANETIIANIKPEIGKVRPVIVIYPHKRHKLAVVIPFTTKKPPKGDSFTIFIPIGAMPGILAEKECWALCDMLKVVSIDRLQLPFRRKKDSHKPLNLITLSKDKIDEICSAAQNIFK
ncbi:MAG: type II toxin-antitoxin system PemK/MazF family toxin [Chitinivibrionia bacterium]|nr:type II toxin-antitoxin system PemK/MazF family toxin [Chitinivibrionia bacterium]